MSTVHYSVHISCLPLESVCRLRSLRVHGAGLTTRDLLQLVYNVEMHEAALSGSVCPSPSTHTFARLTCRHYTHSSTVESGNACDLVAVWLHGTVFQLAASPYAYQSIPRLSAPQSATERLPSAAWSLIAQRLPVSDKFAHLTRIAHSTPTALSPEWFRGQTVQLSKRHVLWLSTSQPAAARALRLL